MAPMASAQDQGPSELSRSKSAHAELLNVVPATAIGRSKVWPDELRKRAQAGFRGSSLEWTSCVLLASDSYRALPEPAETVANAAIASCRDWRMAYRVWFGTYMLSQGIITTEAERGVAEAEFERNLRDNVLVSTMRHRLEHPKEGMAPTGAHKK